MIGLVAALASSRGVAQSPPPPSTEFAFERVAQLEKELRSEEAASVRRAADELADVAFAWLFESPPASAFAPPFAEEWSALVADRDLPEFDRDTLLAHLEVMFEECQGDRLPARVPDRRALVEAHVAREACTDEVAAALQLLAARTLQRAAAAARRDPQLPPLLDPEPVVDEALSAWDRATPWSDLAPEALPWRIDLFAEQHALPIARRAALRAAARARGASEWPELAQRARRGASPALVASLAQASDLALRFTFASRHDEADLLGALEGAAELGASLADPALRRRVLASLVDAQIQRGDLVAAGSLLDSLLPMLAEEGVVADGAHLMAAVALRRLGRWEECLELLTRAAAPHGDPEIEARAAGELGIAYGDLGMLELAAEWIEREWSGTKTLAVASRVAASFHRADLLERTRDLAGAAALLEETLARPTLTSQAPFARARLLIRLAHVKLLQEESSATPSARASRATLELALADPRLRAPDRVDGELLLALIALLDGDPVGARAAVARVDASLTGSRASGLGVLARPLRETLLAHAALRLEASDSELRERRNGARAALSAWSDEWRRIAPREGGVGFLQLASRRMLVGALVALELRLEPDGRSALARLDEIGALGSVARAISSAPVPADRPLAPGRGLLLYLPSWIGSQVVVIDGDGAALAPIANELRLVALADELDVSLQLAVTTAPTAEFEAEFAAQVEAARAALLPEPLAARVRGWSAVDVVVGEPLAALPMGLLLGPKLPVSWLPSAVVGAAIEARPRVRAALDVAWIAAPAIASDPRELSPGLVAQLRLRDEFAGGRLLALEGPAATRTALAAALGQGVTLLHCFTHGSFDAARRRPAGLQLTDGRGGLEVLWCDQLAPLDGAVDAVILATCNAGRGPRRIGDEGISDLGGAFLARGARSVLLTHASVPAAATARLMAAVHGELARGASLAGALATASSSVDPEARRVAALFRVVGLGHEPLFERGRFAPATPTATRVLASGRAPGAAAVLALGSAIVIALIVAMVRRRSGNRR